MGRLGPGTAEPGPLRSTSEAPRGWAPCSWTPTDTCTQRDTPPLILSLTPTHKHADMHTQLCTHTHTHACMCVDMHREHMCTHLQAQIWTHSSCMQTRAHGTHMRTRMHTQHTYAPVHTSMRTPICSAHMETHAQMHMCMWTCTQLTHADTRREHN